MRYTNSSLVQNIGQSSERWTLSNAIQVDRSFPLRDAILARPPYVADGQTGMQVFATNDLAIDHPSLVHFAVGVVWKMALYKRKTLKGNVRLGERYQEMLRKVLLGDVPFPDEKGFLSVVLRDGPLQESAFPPYTVKNGLNHLHKFAIPGIAFALALGRFLPENLRTACFARNPARPVVTSKKVDDTIMLDFAKLIDRIPVEKRVPRGVKVLI